MSKNQALEKFTEELYLSYSQIFMYLNYSIKYRFSYVEQRPAERVSIALPFGRALHKALERCYRTLKDSGRVEPLGVLQNLFAETLSQRLNKIPHPVIFKKDAPDETKAIELGRRLVQTFYENIDLAGYRIVDVEIPLSAKLYDENGRCTDFQLIGFLETRGDALQRLFEVLMGKVYPDNFMACRPWGNVGDKKNDG
jgi:putative RecB family exonuclease